MKYLLIIIFCIFSFIAKTQIYNDVFIVEFTDKLSTPYSISSPEQFLSSRAIERRNFQNINIKENDLPVNPDYVCQILNTGEVALKYTSKWLNCAVIETTDSIALDLIYQFDFVKTVKKNGLTNINNDDKLKVSQHKTATYLFESEQYGKSYKQIADINLHYLHKNGYRGKGIQIAVFDAGYNKVDSMEAFRHLRHNNHLLGAKDFVLGNTVNYNRHNHGTMVLSVMAGELSYEYTGTATDADYWLYLTENIWSESLLEEYNWLAAAEHADSIGVDIINSSLAYTLFDDTIFNHSPTELNGKTAIISQAATIAASKGILVCTSAGNSAKTGWPTIGFPADADSILTVGAIKPDSSYAGFSSIGYTTDGRIKPDLTATGSGVYIIAPSDNVIAGNGTSFSSPLIAGAMACLWQYAGRDVSNIDLITAIQQSAHKYNNPDSLMGYGIPNFFNAMLSFTPKEDLNHFIGDSITVYPNPTETFITINYFSSKSQSIELLITSMNGKTLYQNYYDVLLGINTINLDISTFAANVYAIIIKDEDGFAGSKFIKR